MRRGQFGNMWVDIIIWLLIGGIFVWLIWNYVRNPGESIWTMFSLFQG